MRRPHVRHIAATDRETDRRVCDLWSANRRRARLRDCCHLADDTCRAISGRAARPSESRSCSRKGRLADAHQCFFRLAPHQDNQLRFLPCLHCASPWMFSRTGANPCVPLLLCVLRAFAVRFDSLYALFGECPHSRLRRPAHANLCSQSSLCPQRRGKASGAKAPPPREEKPGSFPLRSSRLRGSI